MKIYRGSGRTAPLIPNQGRRWRLMVTLTTRPLYPQGKSSVPSEQKDGWAPEGVCALRRKKNFLGLLGFEPRLVQPVALVTIMQTVAFCKHIPALSNSGLFQVLLLQKHWRSWYRCCILDDYNLLSPVSNLTIKIKSWMKVHSSSRLKRRWG
jgi:hypothetical protein